MGKILEILKHGDGNGSKPAEPALRPRPYHPESAESLDGAGDQLAQEAEVEEESEDEVPFIEVGGPRKTLEASPSVLAATVSRLKKTEPPLVPKSAPEKKEEPTPQLQLPEEPPVLAPVVDRPPQILTAPAPPVSEPALVAVTYRPLQTAPPPLPPAKERFALELVSFHRTQHPVSQQYRALLGALHSAPAPGGSEALLFSASGPGVGTTTTVLNLAITAARDGKLGDRRVVVVDAAFRRPAVALKLGLPPAPGLYEVLAGTISLQRALQESGQPGLHVLTTGAVGPEGSGGRLVGETMRAVMRHLRSRYDLIAIDTMPWDGRPDLVALGALCDAAYLVVRHEDQHSPDVAELLQVIPQQGSRLRGCILTYR